MAAAGAAAEAQLLLGTALAGPAGVPGERACGEGLRGMRREMRRTEVGEEGSGEGQGRGVCDEKGEGEGREGAVRKRGREGGLQAE